MDLADVCSTRSSWKCTPTRRKVTELTVCEVWLVTKNVLSKARSKVFPIAHSKFIVEEKSLSVCRWIDFVFFFCIRCDDRAKSSGRWLLGSPLSAVVRQLAPRAWWPLQCLLAKTVGVLSPGVGRCEESAQVWAGVKNVLRTLLLRATFTVG